MRDLFWKYLLCVCIVFSCGYSASAQERSRSSFEGRVGSGLLLNVVPLSVLDAHQLNLPGGEAGIYGALSYQYMFSRYLFVGYQFDYLGIKGDLARDVENNSVNYDVHTNVFGHSLVIGSYLRNTRKRHTTTGKIYYKIGGISLNLPKTDFEGRFPALKVSLSDAGFGVLTGLGLGVEHRLTTYLSLLGNVEYNHITSTISEVYRPYKMFYDTPYTVSNYLAVSVGMRIGLNGSKGNTTKQKRSSSPRKSSSKKRKSKANYFPWSGGR